MYWNTKKYGILKHIVCYFLTIYFFVSPVEVIYTDIRHL